MINTIVSGEINNSFCAEIDKFGIKIKNLEKYKSDI